MKAAARASLMLVAASALHACSLDASWLVGRWGEDCSRPDYIFRGDGSYTAPWGGGWWRAEHWRGENRVVLSMKESERSGRFFARPVEGDKVSIVREASGARPTRYPRCPN